MFWNKKKEQPKREAPKPVEQVIPCTGEWFAIIYGVTGFGANSAINLRALPVCAWKYVQDHDAEYTVIEPLVWVNEHTVSCQFEPGFRGCVAAGDDLALAERLLDADIEGTLDPEVLNRVCKLTKMPKLGDMAAADRISYLRQKMMPKPESK
jgi:hypothetical protein